jgi:subfamily B ATP-binding cassette protein MsbA
MPELKKHPLKFSEFKEIYQQLLRYALNYKFSLLLSIVFMLIFSLTNTGFLALLKEITDNGFDTENSIIKIMLPISLMVLMLIRACSSFMSGYHMRKTSRGVVADLRIDTFKKYLKLPVSYFDNNNAGMLVSKLTYEADQLSAVITRIGITIIRESFTVIALFIYMIYLDWFLTLVFLLMTPVIIRYLKKVSPRLRSFGFEVQETMGNMTSASEEAVTGQRVIKVFGAINYELQRFTSIVKKNMNMQIRLAKLSLFNSMLIEIIASIALGVIVYYALANFTTGEFAAFVGALLMMIKPIKSLTEVNESLQVSIAAAKSIMNVLNERNEKNQGKKVLPNVKGDIEIKNLSFQYGDNDRSVLNQISLKIKRGQKIALVGKSGGGKTTLMNLLPRFYDFKEGDILVDKVNIKDLKLDNLRSFFSLVTQDTILFNDTIRNNICYGNQTIKISDKRLNEIIDQSNCREFIEKLPKKLDNLVGDRGVKLSGGQKQRIAIARAIIKDAPILLLDEATSALDLESEKLVQNALDHLMKNKTSIIIAHRLSTVKNADKIFVLDKGSIIESGNHDELIRKKGFYSKLYKKELS